MNETGFLLGEAFTTLVFVWDTCTCDRHVDGVGRLSVVKIAARQCPTVLESVLMMMTMYMLGYRDVMLSLLCHPRSVPIYE